MITNLQIVHYVPEAIFYMAEFTFLGFCCGSHYLALPSEKEHCALDTIGHSCQKFSNLCYMQVNLPNCKLSSKTKIKLRDCIYNRLIEEEFFESIKKSRESPPVDEIKGRKTVTELKMNQISLNHAPNWARESTK